MQPLSLPPKNSIYGIRSRSPLDPDHISTQRAGDLLPGAWPGRGALTHTSGAVCSRHVHGRRLQTAYGLLGRVLPRAGKQSSLVQGQGSKGSRLERLGVLEAKILHWHTRTRLPPHYPRGSAVIGPSSTLGLAWLLDPVTALPFSPLPLGQGGMDPLLGRWLIGMTLWARVRESSLNPI